MFEIATASLDAHCDLFNYGKCDLTKRCVTVSCNTEISLK